MFRAGRSGEKLTELQADVKNRFGVLPNFFRLAPEQPDITRNLWGFAKFAYLDNPLPSLFKERLFVFLSRFCEVRYCITRHLGFLIGLGRPSGDERCSVQSVKETLQLLRRPLSRGEPLEKCVLLCNGCDSPGAEMPPPDSEMEQAIFDCAAHVFLQTSDAPRCLEALQRRLGVVSFQHLTLFLAFIRTAHYWTQIHPELEFEDDVNDLLAKNRQVAECLLNDPEASACKVSQKLLGELAELRSKKADFAARRLAAIVESSEDAIVFKDLDGIIKSWNKGAQRIFGYTAEEALGNPVTILVPQDRLDEESGILARIRRGERVDHYETVRRRKDGKLLHISLSVSPVKDDQGQIIGASKIARDITARKKAEQELAQAMEREKIARQEAETAMSAKDRFLATFPTSCALR